MINRLRDVLTPEQQTELDKVTIDVDNVERTVGRGAIPSDILLEGFEWVGTPQGYDYWNDIYDGLCERGL